MGDRVYICALFTYKCFTLLRSFAVSSSLENNINNLLHFPTQCCWCYIIKQCTTERGDPTSSNALRLMECVVVAMIMSIFKCALWIYDEDEARFFDIYNKPSVEPSEIAVRAFVCGVCVIDIVSLFSSHALQFDQVVPTFKTAVGMRKGNEKRVSKDEV